MGRDKLTLVGAGCVLTVHSSWNIGAQEEKKHRLRDFCLFVGVGVFFVRLFWCFCYYFFLSPAHFLMGQQADPM